MRDIGKALNTPLCEYTGIEDPVNPRELRRMKAATPARIGVGRTGARYNTETYLRLRADQAEAAEAVSAEVDAQTLQALGLFEVTTLCNSKYEMRTRPDLGRLFSYETKEILKKRCVFAPTVQLYVGDGLSSPSVRANAADLLSTITAGLKAEGVDVGTPFFVRYCRVNTARHISELLHSTVTGVLIGERPGLLTAESMSAYIAYGAKIDMEESRYNVVSNISRFGTPPVEAAAHIVDLILKMLEQKTSGTELNAVLP